MQTLGLQNQMNRAPLVLLLLSTSVFSYAGESSFLAPSHVATWSFMQSVGGMRVGSPEKKEKNSWLLPVICDVSGLTTITQKPTAINSGLVVTQVPHRIEGNEIHISVALNTPLNKSGSSRCKDIVLSGIKPASYNVLYAEPNKATHAIGTIKLQ